METLGQVKIRLARCWRVGRRVVCGSDDALPTVSAAISLRGCGSGTRQVRCLGNWRRLGGLFRLRSVHIPVTETGSGAAPLCHPAGTGRVPPRGAGLCVSVPVIPEVREAGREPTGVGRGRLRRRALREERLQSKSGAARRDARARGTDAAVRAPCAVSLWPVLPSADFQGSENSSGGGVRSICCALGPVVP